MEKEAINAGRRRRRRCRQTRACARARWGCQHQIAPPRRASRREYVVGFTRFNRERRLFFVFFGVISSFPPFSVGAVEAGVMHCGFCGLSSFILSDSEVEPLNIGPNIAPRYNDVNLHPNFFCHFECVITRRTVRRKELFV